MRRSVLAAVAVVACLSVGACGPGSGGAAEPGPSASGAVDSSTSAPEVVNPLGLGEHLLLVVGGVYPTKAKAEAAVARSNGGELQGYYLAPADDFDVVGMRDDGPAGRWLAVSAFRTRAGADEFVFGVSGIGKGQPVVLQVLRTGGTADIGLGQEANPDGSGPLVGPLPNQEELQD